jgi:exodeoxyribonuclease-3
MRLISWNVNGLRACIKKGFMDYFEKVSPDFLCIQETKLQEGQVDIIQEGYHQFWNYAEKKGYSGTAIFAKKKPLNVKNGIGVDGYDDEGRVITLEYEDFYLVCLYAPNSQRELKRLAYRMEWENAFRGYVSYLDSHKPVIICGDMNVAHNEIDLKNDKTNHKSAGFSDEEREKFTTLLDNGFTDSFRYLYPDLEGKYTWWSYMFNARANNTGWRIDYFLVSDRINEKIKDSIIHSDVMGSDHCPVELDIDL